ncbi:MAG: LamG-like jellyroll fold domain-containing protein [Elusimicrobiota bacterium]
MKSLLGRASRRSALWAALLFLLPAPAFSALSDGLIGHWSFDEASGASAYDSSGNFSTGVVTGAAWTTGRIGGAIEFAGVGDDKVIIAHKALFNTPSAMSVSIWVYNRAPNCNCDIATDYNIVSKKGSTYQNPNSWNLYWGAKNINMKPYFAFRARRSDNTGDSHVLRLNQNKNVWIHLVAVFNAGFLSLYENGVLVGGPNYIGSTTMFLNTQPIQIGSSVLTYPWNGLMDDFRLYNRVLTATEVGELYALGNAPATGSSLSPQVGAISVSSIAVSWSTVSAFGYMLEASTDAGFRGVTLSSASASAATPGLVLVTLTPNTTYFLRVAVASDAFSAASLAAAWVSSDTAGNATISLSNNPGHLQFARPGGSAGSVRVLRDIPNINGSFETKIDGVNLGGAGSQGYGLILLQTDGNYMTFQYRQDGSGHAAGGFRTNGASTTEVIPRAAVTMGTTNGLRITRSSATFTLEHRQDAGAWTVVGSFTDSSFLPAKAGLWLESSAAAPATTANFDDFVGPYALANSTATATLAATPGAVSFGNVAPSQFQARWNIAGNPAGTRYEVRIATAIDFTTVLATAATVSSHTVFASLTSNTTYFVRVRAVNFAGVPTEDAEGVVVTGTGLIIVSADRLPNVWSNAANTVLFAQGGGATRFFYRISANAGDSAQITDTEFDGSAQTAALAEGYNYIHVLGTDGALTTIGRSVFGPITIDRSSPTIVSLTAQRGATNTTPIPDGGSTFLSTPRLFWAASSISPLVGYSYSISQSPSEIPADSVNTTVNFTDIGLGQPSVYYVKVRALNQAGTFGDPVGMSFTFGAVPDSNAVTIRKNYFSPLRGECARLDIQVSAAGKVKAVVYTLLGQRVSTLVDADAAAGSYTYPWCGKNDAGQTVSVGGYLLRVEAPGHKKTLMLAVGK